MVLNFVHNFLIRINKKTLYKLSVLWYNFFNSVNIASISNSFTIFAGSKKLTIVQLTINNWIWPPSSMDRISDSGSEDMGSNPVGVTWKATYEIKFISGFLIEIQPAKSELKSKHRLISINKFLKLLSGCEKLILCCSIYFPKYTL